MKLSGSLAALVAMLFAGSFATSVLAQPQQNRGAQQIDPAQAQQQFRQYQDRDNQQIREQLGASDEEWAVLQPRIQKVRDAQTAAGEGTLGGLQRLTRGRAGGAAGININSLLGIKDSSFQLRAQELQKALDDPNTTEAQIKLRLDAVREAKARAMQVLAQARKELIEILTQRQEAVLFQAGVLD